MPNSKKRIPKSEAVIKDDGLKQLRQTKQIKITDENCHKYGAAFTVKTFDMLVKIYGRLGYMIKLLEGKDKDNNPTVI